MTSVHNVTQLSDDRVNIDMEYLIIVINFLEYGKKYIRDISDN